MTSPGADGPVSVDGFTVPPPPGAETPVPPGPGVRPPFAAPPTDVDRTRLWIGLGIGGAVLLLCCGGGVFGIGALCVAGTDQINQGAQGVVRAYVTAQARQDYGAAYVLQCRRERDRESEDEFVDRLRREPRITQFQLYDFEIERSPANQGSYLVPADLRLDNGQTRRIRYRVVVDKGEAAYQVCGTTG